MANGLGQAASVSVLQNAETARLLQILKSSGSLEEREAARQQLLKLTGQDLGTSVQVPSGLPFQDPGLNFTRPTAATIPQMGPRPGLREALGFAAPGSAPAQALPDVREQLTQALAGGAGAAQPSQLPGVPGAVSQGGRVLGPVAGIPNAPQRALPTQTDFTDLEKLVAGTAPEAPDPLTKEEQALALLGGLATGAAQIPARKGSTGRILAAAGAAGLGGLAAAKAGQREREAEFQQQERDFKFRQSGVELEKLKAEQDFQLKKAEIEFENEKLTRQVQAERGARMQPTTEVVGNQLLIFKTTQDANGNLQREVESVTIDEVVSQYKSALAAQANAAALGSKGQAVFKDVPIIDIENLSPEMSALFQLALAQVVQNPDSKEVQEARALVEERMPGGANTIAAAVSNKGGDFLREIEARTALELMARQGVGISGGRNQ